MDIYIWLGQREEQEMSNLDGTELATFVRQERLRDALFLTNLLSCIAVLGVLKEERDRLPDIWLNTAKLPLVAEDIVTTRAAADERKPFLLVVRLDLSKLTFAFVLFNRHFTLHTTLLLTDILRGSTLGSFLKHKRHGLPLNEILASALFLMHKGVVATIGSADETEPLLCIPSLDRPHLAGRVIFNNSFFDPDILRLSTLVVTLEDEGDFGSGYEGGAVGGLAAVTVDAIAEVGALDEAESFFGPELIWTLARRELEGSIGRREKMFLVGKTMGADDPTLTIPYSRSSAMLA